MFIKPGVRVQGIGAEILLGVTIASEVAESMNFELVITSFTEGKHSARSLHYTGEAADLRRRNIPDVPAFIKAVKERLGPDYDLIDEGDHLHLEHDPK